MIAQKKRNRGGAAAVEFAVAAPILFLLVFAAVEFGRLIMVQQLLVNSAREGARKGALASTTSDNQIDQVVRERMAAGVPSSLANDTSKTIVTITPTGSYSGMAAGVDITVTIQIPINDISWFRIFASDGSLRASSTIKRE